jgi:hypothetical protein
MVDIPCTRARKILMNHTQLAVQQKAMRHTDIRTTMIYGDVVDGRIGQALEKVSGLVFANSTQAARGDA